MKEKYYVPTILSDIGFSLMIWNFVVIVVATVINIPFMERFIIFLTFPLGFWLWLNKKQEVSEKEYQIYLRRQLIGY